MARRLGMGASSAARPGDRLEAGGHVVRLEDPRDRGVLVVEPTAAGREPVG